MRLLPLLLGNGSVKKLPGNEYTCSSSVIFCAVHVVSRESGR
jgi:hypothetical protein